MATKNDSLWIKCLKERLDIMDKNERQFALSLIQFFENQGRLSEKQEDGARKLVVRLICERDKFFLTSRF